MIDILDSEIESLKDMQRKEVYIRMHQRSFIGK